MSNTKLNFQLTGKTKLKIFKKATQTTPPAQPTQAVQPTPPAQSAQETPPVQPAKSAQATPRASRAQPLKVLYEDNHLIAVEKPAGIPVQADESKDPCLMDEVKKYLREKYQKPGNVFLGLLHRLDRPVRGILLFAKTSKGASRLSEQFRNHTVQKIYHAFTENKPSAKKATLVHYLQKDHKKNIVKAFNTPGPNRQRAELDYEIMETSLIIHLKTGRSHQIRAQLSAIRCPIIGDLKYGAKKPLPDKSIALTATSLTFTTATGEKTITLEIKPENPKSHA